MHFPYILSHAQLTVVGFLTKKILQFLTRLKQVFPGGWMGYNYLPILTFDLINASSKVIPSINTVMY